MSLKLIISNPDQRDFSLRISETIENLGESIRLSGTSFILDTDLDSAQVLTKLLRVTQLEDHVYVMELTRDWSGYGEVRVNDFLEGHL